jgi:tetratricopeptide (TPR) repeat protein
MCRNLNVPAITTMYLESVIKKFHPDNDDLIGYLANEYSRNPQTRDKALEMVNSIVGVTKADNQYQLTDSVQLTEGKLAAFFDVYIHLNMYSDILDIGSLICMHNSDNAKISSITLRNMANAAIRLEKFSDGKVYLDMLLKVDASNDIVHWIYSQYYNAIEDYPAAISEIETCIRLDRNDTDYYFAMAAYICDDYIARDPQTLMIQKIGPNESAEYAVPFLITALTIDPSVRSRVLDFLRRNKFTAYIAPLVEAYEVDTDDFRSVFPNLDYRSVDYCLGVESK